MGYINEAQCNLTVFWNGCIELRRVNLFVLCYFEKFIEKSKAKLLRVL